MIGTLQHTDDQKVTLPAFVFDTKARHTLCVSLQEAVAMTAVTTLAQNNVPQSVPPSQEASRVFRTGRVMAVRELVMDSVRLP